MQETNETKRSGKGKLYAKRAVKALILIALCVAVDVAITLALEPYGNVAEATWYEYRTTTAAGESYDTIMIGSSFGRKNIDPYVLDDELGCNSFSLATPSQSLTNTLATLKTAYEDHHVKRAIMLMGPEAVQNEPWFYAQVTFMQSKSLGESVPDVLENVGRLAFDEVNFPSSQSVTWTLPWFYSCVDLRPSAILNNINNRLTIDNPIDAYKKIDPSSYYAGKGHGGLDMTLNMKTASISSYMFPTDDLPLDKNMSDLEKVLKYAEDNGIELYVVISPRPAYATLMHAEDNYANVMSDLQAFVEARGGIYLDTNLTHPDFYRAEDSEFADGQHLNIDGSVRLTKALSKLVSMCESGQDTSSLLYSYTDWNELIATYDDVELVYLEQEKDASTRTVTYEATAIAQPGLELEYLFEVKGEDGTWKAASPWGSEPTLTYDLPEGHGTIKTRVKVRVAGTQKAARTYRATTSY